MRGQLSGTKPEPFVVEGEDWFALDDPSTLAWPAIVDVVSEEQRKLAAVVGDLDSDTDRFNLILGVTCHAVYHAGQIQLIHQLVRRLAS